MHQNPTQQQSTQDQQDISPVMSNGSGSSTGGATTPNTLMNGNGTGKGNGSGIGGPLSISSNNLSNSNDSMLMSMCGVTNHVQTPLLDIHKGRPIRLSVKVMVPVHDHPNFNFVGKLLGPKGNSLKWLQEQTQTKMAILGKGSMRDKQKEEEYRKLNDAKYAHLNEELHVEITCFAPAPEAYTRIGHALHEVKRFLVPDYYDEIRQQQLRELGILTTDRRFPPGKGPGTPGAPGTPGTSPGAAAAAAAEVALANAIDAYSALDGSSVFNGHPHPRDPKPAATPTTPSLTSASGPRCVLHSPPLAAAEHHFASADHLFHHHLTTATPKLSPTTPVHSHPHAAPPHTHAHSHHVHHGPPPSAPHHPTHATLVAAAAAAENHYGPYAESELDYSHYDPGWDQTPTTLKLTAVAASHRTGKHHPVAPHSHSLSHSHGKGIPGICGHREKPYSRLTHASAANLNAAAAAAAHAANLPAAMAALAAAGQVAVNGIPDYH